MPVLIRDAHAGDAPTVVRLIVELARSEDETSPISAAFVAAYLATPNCFLLLAESEGQVVGLLSYSTRPDLYHAAPSVMIDQLIVSEAYQGSGIGSALLAEVFERAQAAGAAEVSVTTMPDNAGAQRFYRAHGLLDEAVFLERHFGE